MNCRIQLVHSSAEGRQNVEGDQREPLRGSRPLWAPHWGRRRKQELALPRATRQECGGIMTEMSWVCRPGCRHPGVPPDILGMIHATSRKPRGLGGGVPLALNCLAANQGTTTDVLDSVLPRLRGLGQKAPANLLTAFNAQTLLVRNAREARTDKRLALHSRRTPAIPTEWPGIQG